MDRVNYKLRTQLQVTVGKYLKCHMNWLHMPYMPVSSDRGKVERVAEGALTVRRSD